jgi:Flp pilus assembly protein TadG
MKRTSMNRRNHPRRGAVAVLVAAMLVALISIMAIAMDGGLLLDNRQRVQGAADAAAISAATRLFANYPAIEQSGYGNFDPNGEAAAAALASAQANGYANDGTNSKVTVNVPPKSGPFTGRAGYVETIVTNYQKRYFSSIWDSTPITTTGRAVARGRWAGSGQGIIVLDPLAKSALSASGTGTMTVTGGASVIVDSSDSWAADAGGGGGITAEDFEITGSYNGALNGEIHTGVMPSPDPLRYLPEPAIPANGRITTKNLGQGNKEYTLTPGRYTNLPGFNTGDVVKLQQGGTIYIDGGGFKSTGASIIMDPGTTGGVLIYNHPISGAQSQQIQISGNSAGTVNVSGRTSGPYAGILLFQKRSSDQQMSIAGGGNFNLKGTFYAANANLQITGNGDAVIGSQYISRTLTLGGNGNIRIDYTDNGTARTREATLVE